MKFSTKDHDNDIFVGVNCAETRHGAWWYINCYSSNLNGKYLPHVYPAHTPGIDWDTWHGEYYSLKKTEMKIRPN